MNTYKIALMTFIINSFNFTKSFAISYDRPANFATHRIFYDIRHWDGLNNSTLSFKIWAPIATTTQSVFPLIIVAHGGAEWNTLYDDYGQFLAARGYYVVLPIFRSIDIWERDSAYNDHQIKSCISFSGIQCVNKDMFSNVQRGDIFLQNYARTIKALINELSTPLHKYILKSRLGQSTYDLNKIGFAGHSLGGIAGMGLAGAGYLDENKLIQTDLHDPRIKRFLLLDPGINDCYSNRKIVHLKNVVKPIFFLMAELPNYYLNMSVGTDSLQILHKYNGIKNSPYALWVNMKSIRHTDLFTKAIPPIDFGVSQEMQNLRMNRSLQPQLAWWDAEFGVNYTIRTQALSALERIRTKPDLLYSIPVGFFKKVGAGIVPSNDPNTCSIQY